jgi:hypothetical protein
MLSTLFARPAASIFGGAAGIRGAEPSICRWFGFAGPPGVTFAVVVVDDGSPDGTAEALQRVLSRRQLSSGRRACRM